MLPYLLCRSVHVVSPKVHCMMEAALPMYFGLGISNNQLNYHVMPNGVYAFAGGKNGDGTELNAYTGQWQCGYRNTITPATPSG